jgi:hypothetical protein
MTFYRIEKQRIFAIKHQINKIPKKYFTPLGIDILSGLRPLQC